MSGLKNEQNSFSTSTPPPPPPPLISFHAKYKNGTSVDLSYISINHLEAIGHNVDQNAGVI